MRYFKQLAAVVVAGSMVLPPAPLHAGTRKGDKLRNQARVEEVKGNLQHALDLTTQAIAEDPGDPSYALQAHRVRFELGVQHVKTGQQLRAAGNLAAALAEFEKGYAIDPASDIAAQEIQRTHQMMDREKNGTPAGDTTPGRADASPSPILTPAAAARKEAQDRTDSLLPVPILRPLNSELIDLKMFSKPRTLFETLASYAGINVIFDPDYTTQVPQTPVQVDLKGTTVEAALDQVSLQTKSFWQARNANTILVSMDDRNHRAQYTEQVVKVFYLSNTTTQQEVSEILTVLRTVVDVQKVFNYSAENALVVRCDADAMALVEKLISDLDKPRPEVIVDVLVMQVSSTYIRNLGGGLSNGINATATFTPRTSITAPSTASTSTATTSTTTTDTTTTGTSNTTTAGAAIPLSQLGHISSADYAMTGLPSAQFEAMLTDSSTRVLQAPQIRASNNTKATINIGDKIPIATGSFSSAVGAVGALPAANTQFSFQDVGVNVEIQPQVHDNNEITMIVTLDVSAVKDRIDVGGVSQPEITQNKLTSDIRLKEGEVNLIGGLITDSNSKSMTGFPGLAKIPLIGRLFSNENAEKDKEELVIALIPHIVRSLDVTASNLKGVAAGNATQIHVSYDTAALRSNAVVPGSQVPVVVPAPSGAAPRTAAPTPTPMATPAMSVQPVVNQVPVKPSATPPPATAPPMGANLPNIPGMTPPAPSAAGARVSLQPSTSNATLNSNLTMTIYAENVVNMADVAAQLQYDPKILRIVNITGGDLPGRNMAAPLAAEKKVLDDQGRADMRINRGSGDGAISGSGALFQVSFQAIGRGSTSVSLASIAMGGPSGPLTAGVPPPAVVSVQ